MTASLEVMNHLAFLGWVRRTTESWWATSGAPDFKSFINGGGNGWRLGSRWTGGYAEEQIRAFEVACGLDFPAPYRLFLRTLGCVTPRQFAFAWADDHTRVEILEGAQSPFTDWEQPESVQSAREWVIDGLLFDVEHNALWRPEWGSKPDTKEQQRVRLTDLVNAAPRLVPVFGHRFLVASPAVPQGVVLSIMQSDIIVYGETFPLYLLNELSDVLQEADPVGFAHWAHVWSEQTRQTADVVSLPFWGSLIT